MSTSTSLLPDTSCAKDALYSATIALTRAQIPTASLDARILLQHILGIDRETLLADDTRMLTLNEHKAYQALIAQRLERKPVSQLIGAREFFGRVFCVTEDTLDPRPDSETLIEAVLAKFRDRKAALRILDLGTGTGCLLLTLLSEYENATGVGVDISEAALQVSHKNAEALGLKTRAMFMQSRWTEKMEQGGNGWEKFDIVISNPPYIATGDIAFLAPEVNQHEPHLALDGGYDGLDCYRELIPQFARLLATNGLAVLEIGAGQAIDVCTIATNIGIKIVEIRHDLGSIERCIVLGL